MTVDREQARRAAEAWGVEITTPGDVSTDAWEHLQDVVFGDGHEPFLALLDELEQVEKGKDDATDAWQLEIKRALAAEAEVEERFTRQGAALAAAAQLRRQVADLEARLAKVPALVEAMRQIANGSWAVGMPKYVDSPREFARAALEAWEQTP